jgi:HEAT repeat protein
MDQARARGAGGFMKKSARLAAILVCAFFIVRPVFSAPVTRLVVPDSLVAPVPPVLPDRPGPPDLLASPSPQATFESVVAELKSGDKATRLRAVRLLKDAAYPEAAIPLAALVTDRDDEVQIEAIAAELNIFLAQRIVTRRRVGLVIEVRNKIAADAAFSQGPLAIGARPVPAAVLTALRTAARDTHPLVAVESLYAFGTLAIEPTGPARRALLRETAPDLASMIGAANLEYRYAAIRVIGRVFERRAEDDPVEAVVGDAVVSALNDNDRGIRGAAMQALGAMRYERAVAALTEQFQYFGRGELAEAALEALARIAHPASTPLFVTALGAKQNALKAFAIEGLARVGDGTRRAGIETAIAGDNDERLLLAAAFAAVLLSDAPLDPLVDALRKPRVAVQARQYLIEIARGRTSAFARHAQDPDVQIRVGVADALGLAGDPAGLPIVEAMQRDRDQQVVQAAERAVARLSGPRRDQ